MIGQRFPILDWPYKEGLRIDEAMHDLTIMVTGLYGKKLPNQNGSPFRLIVPWKYGFKSAKSIVKIRLTKNVYIYRYRLLLSAHALSIKIFQKS